MKIPRVLLTLGEPAGIGPDLALTLAQRPFPAQIIVVGSPDLLKQRAKILGLECKLRDFDPSKPALANGRGCLAIYPVPLKAPCIPGQLSVENSEYVLTTLRQAYHLCAQKHADAWVTGPVHKAIIQQSGTPFSGHTGFLADLAGVKEVLMAFYTSSLIVGLVTTHCPLQEVSKQLTPMRLTRSIQLLHQGLQDLFQKTHPHIGICGLNPHAGESGLLGHEEETLIIPVLEKLRNEGLHLEGPMPADTAFTEKIRNRLDAILAMYHDQGLAPIKALYFGETVNITFGLPFLRTSVDHGTALDLAGTGKADPTSLSNAIALTARLSSKRLSPQARISKTKVESVA